MTMADLPPANTRRWVARRKAQVVFAVRAGLISLTEACERYHLTVEEFASWQRMIERHGLRGLRVTRLSQYSRAGVKSRCWPFGRGRKTVSIIFAISIAADRRGARWKSKIGRPACRSGVDQYDCITVIADSIQQQSGGSGRI